MHNLTFHFNNVYPQQCSGGIRVISQKGVKFRKDMFTNGGLCALAWRPTFQQFDIDRKGSIECGLRQCLTFSIACHIRWTKRQVVADIYQITLKRQHWLPAVGCWMLVLRSAWHFPQTKQNFTMYGSWTWNSYEQKIKPIDVTIWVPLMRRT